MLRTIAYIRKSSEETKGASSKVAKQELSFDYQTASLEKFLYKEQTAPLVEGYPCVIDNPERDIIMEDGSAKAPGREEFTAMIKRIKNKSGYYDVLWARELSRLSRNAYDMGLIVQLLEEDHIQEIRTEDKRFRKNPTDIFTLGLLLMVGKYENDQRAVNTGKAMKAGRKKGKTMHKARIGYKNAENDKGERVVVKNPNNWDQMHEAWHMFATGKYTLRAVFDHAIDQGMQHFYKGAYSPPSYSHFCETFTSRYYLGMIQEKNEAGDTVWIDGNHEPMITPELFDAVQIVLLKQSKKRAKPSITDRNPEEDTLRILCNLATSGMHTFTDAEGNTRPSSIVPVIKKRYTCACAHRFYSATKPTKCKKCGKPASFLRETTMYRYGHTVRGKGGSNTTKDTKGMKKLLEYVTSELDKITIPQWLFDTMRGELKNQWDAKQTTIDKQQKDLQKKIDQQSEKLKTIKGNLFANDEHSTEEKQEMREMKKELEIEIKKMRSDRSKLETDTDEIFDTAWTTLQILRDAKDILSPETPFEPKKELLFFLSSNLIIYEDSFKIEWREPFATLMKNDNDSQDMAPKKRFIAYMSQFG